MSETDSNKTSNKRNIGELYADLEDPSESSDNNSESSDEININSSDSISESESNSDSDSYNDDKSGDDDNNNDKNKKPIYPPSPIPPKRRKASQMQNNKLKYVFFLVPEVNGNNNGNNNENNNMILDTKTKKIKNIIKTCTNPLCDHKEKSTVYTKFTKDKIENIKDLIQLGKSYHCKMNLLYKNIKLEQLYNIVEPLVELDNMIGLQDIKIKIVNQILFFLQNFHKNNNINDKNIKSTEMLHTIITGPPGVGKTQFGKIIGKIYARLGILSNGTFNEIKRSDLIGKYLGHTAAKTQEAINKCKGGVMFIDEAYSLGHKEGRDSFSKECLDVINQNLTENRDFLCILAGYERELDKCVFSVNPGLKRRFTFRYNIDQYSPKELFEIFKLKIKDSDWELKYNEGDEKNIYRLFVEKKNCFPFFGGDIETLVLQCKICHSCSIPNKELHKKITIKDIFNGFNQFIKFRQYNKSNNSTSKSSINIYT